MRLRKKWISLLISSLLLYVASFLALRHGVIAWYELMNPLEPHWLRPAYEPFFYPLRWLDANGWSLLPHAPQREAGTVLEVSPTRLVIKTDDGYAKFIGFACQPSLCPLLDGVV